MLLYKIMIKFPSFCTFLFDLHELYELSWFIFELRTIDLKSIDWSLIEKFLRWNETVRLCNLWNESSIILAANTSWFDRSHFRELRTRSYSIENLDEAWWIQFGSMIKSLSKGMMSLKNVCFRSNQIKDPSIYFSTLIMKEIRHLRDFWTVLVFNMNLTFSILGQEREATNLLQ